MIITNIESVLFIRQSLLCFAMKKSTGLYERR